MLSDAKRFFLALVGLLAFALCVHLVARVAPAPLFAYARAGRHVTLRSDEPLPREADALLRFVEAKVTRSPLFDARRRYEVHLCAHAWRFAVLTGGNRAATGVALAPFGRGVVLRAPDVRANRVRQASGREAPGERTLDYYVAHEITHTMTADRLGLATLSLPAWVREGYADFVARGEGFDYDDARAALRAEPRTRHPPQSGRYLRYTLLVAHLLERERWSVDELLLAPPHAEEVESRVREGQVAIRARGNRSIATRGDRDAAPAAIEAGRPGGD